MGFIGGNHALIVFIASNLPYSIASLILWRLFITFSAILIQDLKIYKKNSGGKYILCYMFCFTAFPLSHVSKIYMSQQKKPTTVLKKMKRILKSRKMSYDDLSSYLGIDKPLVKQYMGFLRGEGVEIPFDKQGRHHFFWIPSAPVRKNLSHTYNIPLDSQGYTNIGLVSDTHIGSKFHVQEGLEKMYDDFERGKVKLALNMGDVTEGNGKMFRGQLYEMSHFGYQDLLKHVVKTYPERDELTSAMISGNHDMSFWNDVGADIVKQIADQREDIDYLGQLASWVTVNGLKGYGVHPSGGMAYARCFSDDTETLTKSGWKLLRDVHKNDLIATRNSEGLLEWQHPTETFEYDWNGILLNFVARGFDLLVTPNHNMFVRRYPKLIKRLNELRMPQKSHIKINDEWQLVEAQHLFNEGGFARQKWQMSKEVDWVGVKKIWYELPRIQKRKFASNEPHHFEIINMNLWLEFLGWYVAEGNTAGKNNKKYSTTITQLKEKGRYLLKKLFQKLEWDVKFYKEKSFTIFGGELAQHLDDICGVGAKNKKVPDFIKDLSKAQISIFLNAILEGDGSKDKRNENRDWEAYGTISDKLKDDLQELFLKVGWGSKKNGRGLSLSLSQNTPTINERPIEVKYKGKVYCIEVPNHVFLVRRNGKIIFSGNSYKMQRQIEQMAIKPDILMRGHLHVSMYLPYTGVQGLESGTFQSQTPYLERKGLHPEVGGWILKIKQNEVGEITEFIPIWKDYSHLC